MEKSARHDIAHVVERGSGSTPTAGRAVAWRDGRRSLPARSLMMEIASVAKIDRRTSPMLAIEGMMLRYLEAHSELPVPHVRFGADDLLIMESTSGEEPV